MNLEKDILGKLKKAKIFAKEDRTLETFLLLREIKESCNLIDINLLNELRLIRRESYISAMKNRTKEAICCYFIDKNKEEAKINCYDALGFAIELLIPAKYKSGF